MSIESNKRIAKNSIALYFRTFITLLVSLYTSRIVLDILGIEDFGIYNVVSSIVVLFSFLSGSLVFASQRFLTFEIGRNNTIEQKRIFSMSLTSVILLALIIILLTETIGLFFINNKLSISEERLYAAKWAYHFSILTFCINILRTPYNATIIANEKMTFFAYISIFEALLKLGIVFLLQKCDFDKLILYTILLALTTGIVNILYWIYCKEKFRIFKYQLFWDKKLFIKLMSFSGWSLLGNGTNIATQNGLIFMINIFWGVTVNAAYGIANQVNAAVINFVSGFQTSFSPQIIKAYAKNENEKLFNLINKTSKFSFMLVFIPALVLMLNMPFILKIWLNTVPYYTIEFSIWMIACIIIDATTGPYNTAIMATGNIKIYQIAISVSFVLDLIMTYVLIKFGITPSLVFISRLLTRGVLNMFIGLHFLHFQLKFDVKKYYREILYPILSSLFLIVPIPLVISKFSSDWYRLLYSIFTSILIGGTVYYKILLTNNEQIYLTGSLKKILLKIKNKLQI